MNLCIDCIYYQQCTDNGVDADDVICEKFELQPTGRNPETKNNK